MGNRFLLWLLYGSYPAFFLVLMRVGVVHTVGSPCRCAESVAKGLESLGHEPFLADSEKIEILASQVADECDLVIDHTDTFRGRGLLRPLVRHLLEVRGARIVGSDSKACFLADDKAAAKTRLSEAGIPTPPGIVVSSKEWTLPPWLSPPLVLKPAFEHMSRGLRLARTEDEACDQAGELLDRLQQPVLVERFIPGRELAISILDGPEDLEILPPLEWYTNPADSGMLSEAAKLMDVVPERRDAGRAELPPGLQGELESLARSAFRSLGLRDYARFDLRLSSGGTFFFLEANTTPSLEPLEALALSAGWAGLDYSALVERILTAALGRYGKPARKEAERVRVDLPTGRVELEVPQGVHQPPESSIDLARLIDVQAGEDVLELGCGTGLLSIAAAKLGARRVVATDLDPRALEATARNVRVNGVHGQIEIQAGSWYDSLGNSASPSGRGERFDVIIATPPQTPGPHAFGPRYGGPDGTRHLFAVVDGAPSFLEPRRGRLWILAISLANPSALLERLRGHFSQVSVVRETERRFTAEEYQAMAEGLFDHFLALRASGCSAFQERGKGEYIFHNLFIRASGIRAR